MVFERIVNVNMTISQRQTSFEDIINKSKEKLKMIEHD